MKIKALMKAILRTIGKLTKGALEPVIVIAIMITFTVLSVYFPVVELIMVGITLLIMLAGLLIVVWVFISSIVEEYEEELERVNDEQ